jgi:anaerobic magnesium-protoporphyrin IX monomethyl ester cyclase
MSKVLLINPSKWGRGITPIWIASHSAVLKSKGHKVKLFDCSFYENWTVNENKFNTENKQYKSSKYFDYITYNKRDVLESLQENIDEYEPDIIFWSAFSSHIHGEGEYVNIQYGYQLIEKIETSAILVTGGLQVTANPNLMISEFPKVNYFLGGETEFTLADFVDKYPNHDSIKSSVKGLIFKEDNKIKRNPPQNLINEMDSIPMYDYSLFEDQVFIRPYNGKIYNAVDYELSRGCPFTCSYCVETVIQDYYGFDEKVQNGVLKNARQYLRNKSAKRIFDEMEFLYKNHDIQYFRCQDTNFLTIDRKTLIGLADLLELNELPIMLYIETRPESISDNIIPLMKRLRIDGVGMGIELASENFRKSSLNRYPAQDKIINAFKILKKAGIKRTTYNIIGLPDETEEMILETIIFNQNLEPDNITVAFYSPYIGTAEQLKSKELKYFDDYEQNIDGQIRTLSNSTLVDTQHLIFYKKYFVDFVRNGLDQLDFLKKSEGLKN